MFKLIKKEINTDSLSRVEDLIDQVNPIEFTHLHYETKEKLYEGNLTCCGDIYFTYNGFIKAIKENLHKLEFIDGFAIYHLIKVKMEEIPKPYNINELLTTIKQQENEIKILRDVIDKGKLFDIRELDKYSLLEPVIGERIFNGLKYNLYEIKETEKTLYGYQIQNDGYMNSMFGLACMAGKFPFHRGCRCGLKGFQGQSYSVTPPAIHITPFKLIQIQISHLFRDFDSGDRRKTNHGCHITDIIWNESVFPQHGGTLSLSDIGHPNFWQLQALKTQHIDLFIAWFQYNIHVLYRRYIKVVYGATLRIYVSVDRKQPEESIWKVGGESPIIV